jgi:hypothetical protein
MRFVRHLIRVSALACTVCALWNAESADVGAQTVGWCAANPGNIYGVAYDHNLNVFYQSSFLSNLAWLDGGVNTSTDCFNFQTARVKDMWSNWYGPEHVGAGDMCASAPGQIWFVRNTMSYVLWNPNGRQAYLDNDGNTVNLGTVNVDSNCCAVFAIC